MSRLDLAVRIGGNLKNIRKQARLTLKTLAFNAGMSVSFLSRVEHGQIIPSLPKLQALADALRVEIEFFFQVGHEDKDLTLLLGTRLQKRSEELGIPLKRIAEHTGLSEAFLTPVLEGKITPSIPALKLIGDALRVNLSYFFQSDEDQHFVVSRAGQRELRSFPRGVGTPSYDVEFLADGFENKFMEPVITTLISTNEDMDMQSHAGQEFIFLLEGRAKIILGKRNIILNKGDSIYFDSRLPHLGISMGKKPAKTLHVHFTPRERIRQDMLRNSRPHDT